MHDGTWKECEVSFSGTNLAFELSCSQGGHTVNDFVRQINDEYTKLNSREVR